jgi:hypothetical protein
MSVAEKIRIKGTHLITSDSPLNMMNPILSTQIQQLTATVSNKKE